MFPSLCQVDAFACLPARLPARVPACLPACRITLELRDRQTKVDVLHSKFEMLASRAHGTDADGGEPKSQAYYIVKVRRQGVGHLLPVARCL